MKTALPITLWAVIVKSKRSEWIHYETIARTKRKAWRKYQEQWNPDYLHLATAELAVGRVRLSRVKVEVAQ